MLKEKVITEGFDKTTNSTALPHGKERALAAVEYLAKFVKKELEDRIILNDSEKK